MLRGTLFKYMSELASKTNRENDDSSAIFLNQPARKESEYGGISTTDVPVWQKVPGNIFVNQSREAVPGPQGWRYIGTAMLYYEPRKWEDLGITFEIQTAEILFRSNIYKVSWISDYQNITGINEAKLVRKF